MKIKNFLEATNEELDAAKRLSGVFNDTILGVPFQFRQNAWLAVRLSDGRTDGAVYDSRREAVRHQSDEKLCAYVSLAQSHGGMDVKEAWTFLMFHRAAYDAGFRLTDPDDKHGGREVIMPIAQEDADETMRRMLLQARGVSYFKG